MAADWVIETNVQDDERATRRHDMSGSSKFPLSWTCPAALAVAMIAGAPLQALAQVPDPDANRVWGGCVLNSNAAETDTITSLEGDIGSSDTGGDLEAEDLEVAFVLVYSLTFGNDGQPLMSVNGTQTTGPILCINDSILGIETTMQTDDIPAAGVADSVDILDAEDVFILRYVLNDEGGPNDGIIEKVLCHTVDSNVDCFRLSPLLPED
jgi:hypothetical protein